jgi:leucyl-tRNA---protein transferase
LQNLFPICDYLFEIEQLSPTDTDYLLENGWFRYSSTVFRTQIQLIDKEIYTPINIRMKIQESEFPKKMRKLFKQNTERFGYTIRQAVPSDEKQELYERYRGRLSGGYPDMLERLINLNEDNPFDTWEVCVYDGSKLVAMSFFDIGYEAVASISGMFDPQYSKYSLGLFTMLLEIDFARRHDLKLYYPGYVLDRPSLYDYKLRIGDLEILHLDTAIWQPYSQPYPDTLAKEINAKMEILENLMIGYGIGFRKHFYPFYMWHYRTDVDQNESLVRYPVFMMVHIKQHRYIIAYDYILEEYVFADIEVWGYFSSDYISENEEYDEPQELYRMAQNMISDPSADSLLERIPGLDWFLVS